MTLDTYRLSKNKKYKIFLLNSTRAKREIVPYKKEDESLHCIFLSSVLPDVFWGLKEQQHSYIKISL